MKVRINDTSGAVSAWGEEVPAVDGHTVLDVAPGAVPADFDRFGATGKYTVTDDGHGSAVIEEVDGWSAPEVPDVMPHERATNQSVAEALAAQAAVYEEQLAELRTKTSEQLAARDSVAGVLLGEIADLWEAVP